MFKRRRDGTFRSFDVGSGYRLCNSIGRTGSVGGSSESPKLRAVISGGGGELYVVSWRARYQIPWSNVPGVGALGKSCRRVTFSEINLFLSQTRPF